MASAGNQDASCQPSARIIPESSATSRQRVLGQARPPVLVNATQNYWPEDGGTPLHWFCYKGDGKVVEMLLKHGADARAKSGVSTIPLSMMYWWTPLHKACLNGHIKVVEMLMEHDADAKAKSKDGATALHAACQRGSMKAVQALLSHNADPKVTTNKEWFMCNFCIKASLRGNARVYCDQTRWETNMHGDRPTVPVCGRIKRRFEEK
ncbi:uncharacterized protein MONBRDRAFT_11416 [Monosiga brevicollis MX1]|uniref:Uncharacterized protein n=1 Tax=Monosiga brevicollis TaxID=81824 RepID=A9V9F8_MONBE|nr:uncharacterized protein MONBRDRAFT_11416 [Monosiga brevicollis MX1]EDQ85855.1 predicted protein [Monosiga brevicollis MX1]|eukprot:XP_001749334.1 hypothetical protein [Monosiga brevicollis MX1]